MDTLQAKGVVKWFSLGKRYGFVTLDDMPGEEALLHLSAVKKMQIDQVPKGSVGEFEIEKTSKGWTISKVISLTLPEAYVNSQNYIAATVRWFDNNRGYGFLTRGEGTADIFVHAVTVKESSIGSLHPGQEVMIVIEEVERGPKAIYIKAKNGHAA